MADHLQIKTLGIAAPASGFEPPRFERGLAVLDELGFDVKVDERAFIKTGYLAGSDNDRAALLTELFTDDVVDAVMCARGGYGSMRLLPLLNLQALADSGKPLIGFSDCTALFCALYALGGQSCWHGPVVTQMGDLDTESLAAFKAALQNEVVAYNVEQGVCLRSGRAAGRFFGGNLTVLMHLAGTAYFPDLRGHILFVEDQNEPLYKIDRMFTQLKLMGVLDRLAGVVLGEFINCGEVRAIHARVLELVGTRDIPVLGGFPAGHGQANLILPLGGPCLLDCAAKTLAFSNGATHAG